MNKTFAIYLLFFGLITHVYADDVLVKVGGPNGENIFDPQTAYAKVGDKVCITIILLLFFFNLKR